MWAIIKILLPFIPTVLGWFGIGTQKDERDVERQAVETLGQQESENASLKNFVATEQDTKDARDSVKSDPSSVWNDPLNRSNPANKPNS